MGFDATFLSRLQFAFTIGFHILFPTLTMGLAVFVAALEGRWLAKGDPFFLRAAQFWSRILALSFGMGVVTGVVLSYEIGTNWADFSRATGNILGPLMSYEVLTAFFLEAGFLGIMLFGWRRVGPKLHFFATAMVALGTFLSAFWILSANSWMNTPSGYVLKDGVFYIDSWWQAIFNPSFPYRLAHMVTATYLTTSVFVAAVCAWYVRRGQAHDFALRTLKIALVVASILAPAQILIGDAHGLNTQDYQPVKVAAMEGHWEPQKSAPLILFAIPDAQAETNDFEIAIPYLGSLILTHSLHGRVDGLLEVPADQRPPVIPVFFAFRIMVAIGVALLALAWFGAWQTWRGRLAHSTRYLRLLTWAGPLGFFAVICGWITTEVGRQPWVVYGLMRTSEAGSPIAAGQVLFSLLLFVVVYSVLFATFLWYLFHLIRIGPAAAEPDTSLPEQGEARPAFLSQE